MINSIEFWYRRKYNLTQNDPRYLDATIEDMELDYWAHYYAERPDNISEVEDDDFDLEAEIAALNNDDDWEEVDFGGD